MIQASRPRLISRTTPQPEPPKPPPKNQRCGDPCHHQSKKSSLRLRPIAQRKIQLCARAHNWSSPILTPRPTVPPSFSLFAVPPPRRRTLSVRHATTRETTVPVEAPFPEVAAHIGWKGAGSVALQLLSKPRARAGGESALDEGNRRRVYHVSVFRF